MCAEPTRSLGKKNQDSSHQRLQCSCSLGPADVFNGCVQSAASIEMSGAPSRNMVSSFLYMSIGSLLMPSSSVIGARNAIFGELECVPEWIWGGMSKLQPRSPIFLYGYNPTVNPTETSYVIYSNTTTPDVTVTVAFNPQCFIVVKSKKLSEGQT